MSKNIICDPSFNPVYKFYVDNENTIYVPIYSENKVIAFNKYGEKKDFVINVESPYAIYGDEDALYVINRTL